MYFSPALCYDFLYQTKEKKSYICMGREKNLLMKIKEGLRKWFREYPKVCVNLQTDVR